MLLEIGFSAHAVQPRSAASGALHNKVYISYWYVYFRSFVRLRLPSLYSSSHMVLGGDVRMRK